MALDERFKGGGAHGVARFLAAHQACDSGFDVRRDEGLGSGQLSITCERCGATVEYKAAEAGELAAGGMPTVAGNGEPAAPAVPPRQTPAPRQGPPPIPAPSAPTPPPGTRRPEPTPPRRSGFLPSWVPVALIGALILAGVVMIAIGLARDDEEPAPPAPPAQQSGEGQGAAQGAPPAAAPGPGADPNQQGGAQAPPQQGGAQAPEQSGGGAPPAAGSAEVPLQRRTFAQRFAIGVPRGWENGVEAGGITLSAPGATAEIVAFFEQGQTPAPQLARAARRFLAQRHPGAQMSGPTPVRLGRYRGLRIEATYQGGREAAVVVSAKGFSHLVLSRIDRGASADIARQVEAALASYRPK
jgi:hypothetical protein